MKTLYNLTKEDLLNTRLIKIWIPFPEEHFDENYGTWIYINNFNKTFIIEADGNIEYAITIGYPEALFWEDKLDKVYTIDEVLSILEDYKKLTYDTAIRIH